MSCGDIVRFGKVCTEAKRITDDYLLTKCIPDSTEVEINESTFQMCDFIDRGIPASHIYINNSRSGKKFFDNVYVAEFANDFGKKVTHVRIAMFSTVIEGNERIFWDQLLNLKSLVILKIINNGLRLFDSFDETWDPENNFPFPENILNVTTLKFCYKAKDFDRNSYVFSNKILPLFMRKIECLGQTFWPKLRNNVKIDFGNYLESVMNMFHQNVLTLKEYDMSYFFELDRKILHGFSSKIMEFLFTSFMFGIKLVALDSLLLEAIIPVNLENFTTFVSTMRNVSATAQHMNLESLEELDIVTSRSSMTKEWEKNAFEKLKHLKILIDSIRLQKICFFGTGVTLTTSYELWTSDLLKYFFVSFKRPTVEDLSIVYTEDLISQAQINKTKLPFIKILQLSNCCPNLKKLTIGWWPGTNYSISKIFTSFLLLEDICFDHCFNLGNVAFIGSNAMDPCCFKLKSNF